MAAPLRGLGLVKKSVMSALGDVLSKLTYARWKAARQLNNREKNTWSSRRLEARHVSAAVSRMESPVFMESNHESP
jgi:hypothetical protein